jgi:hypothetical protein
LVFHHEIQYENIDAQCCGIFQKYPDLLVDFSGLIFEPEDSGDFNTVLQPSKNGRLLQI